MSAVAHIDEYKTGRFYTDEFRGSMSWNGYEHNNLLRNEGTHRGKAGKELPRFTDVALAAGADDGLDARGLAVADFDNDGDLDIALNNNAGDSGRAERGTATLLRNDLGATRPWLAVELEGVNGTREAVGAQVVVESGGRSLLRQVTLGSSYASQHGQGRRLHFGLGEAERIDRMTVRWPGGAEQIFDDLPVRRLVRLREGGEPELIELPGAAEEDASR